MTITEAQIDASLPYLDRIEQAEESVGEWKAPPGQLPWFSFNELAMEFYQALYRHERVAPFNWTEWQGITGVQDTVRNQ